MATASLEFSLTDTLPITYAVPMTSSMNFISLFDDDETRWHAVQTRNTHADGFFVYAVRSTRIYCRPICKARLARRANVRFYDTAELARQNGFRACKRCKPDEQGLMPEEAAVRKIRAFVAARGQEGGERLSLGDMARRTGLSKWHFHRVFKKCVGVTPVEYVRLNRQRGSPGSSLTASPYPNGTLGAVPLLSEGALVTAPELTSSDSPDTSDGVDWLQQLDMMTFDLDPLLAEGNLEQMSPEEWESWQSMHNDTSLSELLEWMPQDKEVSSLR